jgi:serine/threonine protein kinase
VFGSLMLSVRHIHRKRIVHADLKPDNIFCNVERSRVIGVRIGDFGLAGENKVFRSWEYGEKKRHKLTGGTPGYMAPEMTAVRDASELRADDKVDIYACAVILLELLLVPFRTQMERAKCFERCWDKKVLPDFISARLPKTRALLLEMCELEPMMRLSAEEVCKRFDKEVRKELCRSCTQLCCNPTFSEASQPSTNSTRPPPPEPLVQKEKGRAAEKANPSDGPVGHRKHCRKGRRRT